MSSPNKGLPAALCVGLISFLLIGLLGRLAVICGRAAGMGRIGFFGRQGMRVQSALSGLGAAAIVTLFFQYARDTLGASKTMVGNLLSLRMVVRAASVLLTAAMLVMSRLRTLAPFAALIPVFALGNSFIYAGSLFHGVAGSSNRAARMAVHEALLAGIRTGFGRGARRKSLL